MSYLKAFLTVVALVFLALSILILLLWVNSGGFEPYYMLVWGISAVALFLRNRLRFNEISDKTADHKFIRRFR